MSVICSRVVEVPTIVWSTNRRSRRSSVTSASNRVVVLDDDPAALLWIEKTLTHRGYEVFATRVAELALQLTYGREPAVAIVDLDLGDYDGFSVARRIRDALPSIPLILISSQVEAHRGRHVYLGLPRPLLLQKPLLADTLVGAIQRSLAKKV